MGHADWKACESKFVFAGCEERCNELDEKTLESRKIRAVQHWRLLGQWHSSRVYLGSYTHLVVLFQNVIRYNVLKRAF